MRYNAIILVLTALFSFSEAGHAMDSSMLSEVERRFFPYENELTSFASHYGLLVEKYYHGSPTWSFYFTHPEGGQAKLDLSIAEDGEISLQTVWWQDSYAEFTRFLRWGDTIKLSDSDKLVSTLDQGLQDTLRWEVGSWTQVADGYESIWGRYSEQEFYDMAPDWPEIQQRRAP